VNRRIHMIGLSLAMLWFIPRRCQRLNSLAVPKPSNINEIGRHQIEFIFHFPRSRHVGQGYCYIVFTEQIGDRLSLSPVSGKGARDVRLVVEIRSDLPQMPAVESRDALLGKSSAPTRTKPRLQSMRSDASSQAWPSASSKISRARRASSARPVRLGL
jgi:hypothetical protein